MDALWISFKVISLISIANLFIFFILLVFNIGNEKYIKFSMVFIAIGTLLGIVGMGGSQ